MGITAVFVTAALFVLFWHVLWYMLVDDSENYTRITLHEFYEQENIDYIFIGASHVRNGINPQVLDKELDADTFNLASSSQTIDISFLMLKEAVARFSPKHVYIDLGYRMAQEHFNARTSMTPSYLMTDYMKPSLRKTMFLIGKSDSDTLVNSFLLARRNNEDIINIEKIRENIQKKNSDDYKNYAYPEHAEEGYAGKGYTATPLHITEDVYCELKEDFVSEDNIDPAYFEEISKIAAYCESKNIPLSFISLPISSYRLLGYEGYDGFDEKIREAAGQYGVSYTDYNLLKEEYWADDPRMFRDSAHLNTDGAAEFDRLLARDILEGLPEDAFYGSLAEKNSASLPEFRGILYSNDGDIKCDIIQSGDTPLEYRVSLADGADNILISDWDTITSFSVPMEKYDLPLCIETRAGSGPVREYTLHIGDDVLDE